MIYESLATQAAAFVTNLFNIYQAKEMVYHDIKHTQSVVDKCKLIAAQYNLSSEELFILDMAAWFHDTGHLFGEEQGHEEKSVFIMKDYFETRDVDKMLLATIANCILATKIPCKPSTLLEMIVCDADLFHLGTPEFFCMNDLVKQEYEWRYKTQIKDWQQGTLAFMVQHKYFTEYCNDILNKGKADNMKVLEGEVKRS